MSSTIAAIRSDTEQVAKDIDSVEQGFGRFRGPHRRFPLRHQRLCLNLRSLSREGHSP